MTLQDYKLVFRQRLSIKEMRGKLTNSRNVNIGLISMLEYLCEFTNGRCIVANIFN